MPYIPLDGQVWVDSPSTLSPINAARLNHMDEGIAQSMDGAEQALVDAAAASAAAGDASTAAAAASAASAGKLAAVPPGGGERTYASIGSAATQAVAAGATVVLNVNAFNGSRVDYAGGTPPWATIDLANNRIALTAAGLYRVTWYLNLGGGVAGNLFHHWHGVENIGALDDAIEVPTPWTHPSYQARLGAVRGTGGVHGGSNVLWVDAPDVALGRNRRVNGPSIANVGAAPFNVYEARLFVELLIPTGALPSLAVPPPPPPVGEL